MTKSNSDAETKRLKALEDLGILGSEAEQQFDDLVLLASQIYKVPIAAISFIAEDYQWFKAKVGLDVSETSRDVSFCGHAIHDVNVFEITDAELDARFVDNPLVTNSPKIRFYAGAPLIDSHGFALGTLCVIDDQPRHLTEEQKKGLAALGRLVTSHIEMRKWAQLIKQQQSQLVQVSRMAALGQLAGGVAHEINTPLGSLALGLGMLEEKVSEVEKPNVARLNRAVFQISKIVNNLLSFSGEINTDDLIKGDLREIIQDSLSLCKERYKANGVEVRVDLSVTERAIILKLQPVRLSKAILSLLNNAYDAVMTSPTEKWIKISAVELENEVQLLISDAGSRMKAEVQEKMMEPFFTTKGIGKGMGLGLSDAKGIMEKHNGRLVYLPEMPNTTFALVFPKIKN